MKESIMKFGPTMLMPWQAEPRRCWKKKKITQSAFNSLQTFSNSVAVRRPRARGLRPPARGLNHGGPTPLSSSAFAASCAAQSKYRQRRGKRIVHRHGLLRRRQQPPRRPLSRPWQQAVLGGVGAQHHAVAPQRRHGDAPEPHRPPGHQAGQTTAPSRSSRTFEDGLCVVMAMRSDSPIIWSWDSS